MLVKINAITSNKENLKNCKKVFYYKKKTARKYKLLSTGEEIFLINLNRNSRKETKKAALFYGIAENNKSLEIVNY